MPNLEEGSKPFYLGIEGEQAGPFSESEIIRKIKSNEVPSDSLYWTEGQEDWEPIANHELFANTFAMLKNNPQSPEVSETKSQSSQIISETSTGRFKILETDDTSTGIQTTNNLQELELEPVYSQEDPLISDSQFARSRIIFISVGLLALLGLSAGGFYWFSHSPSTELAVKAKQATKRTSAREVAYSKAMTLMATDPNKAIEGLKEIAKISATDKTGNEAIQAVVDHYRKMQKPTDAAQFLMEIKRPEEAARYFATEPGTQSEAANAYFQAFEITQGQPRRENLMAHIQLLLNPLNDIDKAIQRIQLLEKEFPGTIHPYGYYLRTTDERISDIFSRISFHFVQSLMAYFSAELPQINLFERPLIEVKKTKEGNYRILGSYKGKIMLNRDTLSNIYFVFWLSQGSWHMVDTNLTRERKRFAEAEKTRWQKYVLSDKEMLAYMEGVFREQFPKNALHEQVIKNPSNSSSTKPRNLTSVPRY